MGGKMGTERVARGLFLVTGWLQDRDRPVIRPPPLRGPGTACCPLGPGSAWLCSEVVPRDRKCERARRARRRRETWLLISQAEPRASVDVGTRISIFSVEADSRLLEKARAKQQKCLLSES